MHAFWTGVIAGYGIAIPVGAISVLIIEMALRRGFRPGFWAGAGAASADLLYALVAVAAGGAIAVLVGKFALPLKILSGLVLVALGVAGLWKLRRQMAAAERPFTRQGDAKTYGLFLGLTLLNPMTVVYFAALILGGTAGAEVTVGSRLLFVLGAGLASLSWQTLLAAGASLLHQRLPARAHQITSLVGNLIVLGFGINILVPLASAAVRPAEKHERHSLHSHAVQFVEDRTVRGVAGAKIEQQRQFVVHLLQGLQLLLQVTAFLARQRAHRTAAFHRVLAQLQQSPDFLEREAGILRPLHEAQTIEVPVGIHAVARAVLGGARHQADFFVISQRVGR
jgi:arginine exporter protein ArgO